MAVVKRMVMENRKKQLFFFFQFLQETEKEMIKENEKQVMIEKAINLRLMCDYVVSCSYGDIVLIICMLHDYVKMLDEIKADDIQYQAYYRNVFMKMAGRLAKQIEYDYEKQLEKCRKKQQKREDNRDIGEDGLTQFVNRKLKKEQKEKDEAKKEAQE